MGNDDIKTGVESQLWDKGALRRVLSQETACVLSWWCPVWRWRELGVGAGVEQENLLSR
jgi:hypothetical protein